MKECAGDTAANMPFDAAREKLMAHQREVREKVLKVGNAFASISVVIENFLEQLGDWTNIPNRWATLGKGIKNVYRGIERRSTTRNRMARWKTSMSGASK